jgi:hypothetical protein
MNLHQEDTATAVKRGKQRLLGPVDVAEWLGVSPAWVRDHSTRKDPRIKAIKVERLLRFRSEDIEAFLRDSSESVL